MVRLALDQLVVDFEEPPFEACGAVAQTILARDFSRDEVLPLCEIAWVVDAEADGRIGRWHGG